VLLEELELPGEEEAGYLLGGLANLIRQRGVETFLAAPILLAEPRFFPDPMEERAGGVAVLLRRLLAYAGLEPTRLDIEIYPDEDSGPVVREVTEDDPHREAAAWFLDNADGVYRFGVRESELRDEQALIGTLGHEVAHAYRHHHRLNVQDSRVEEQLTDLTTVYLGFGAFTLESSYQFKTGHYGKTGEPLLYETQTRGYLRPGQLAFLLGAQLVMRARERPLDAVLGSLSHNHAEAVRRAAQLLGKDTERLAHQLGLPPAAVWPAPRRLEDALKPLGPTQVRLIDRPRVAEARREREAIAFRVAGTRATLGTWLGLGAGFMTSSWLDLSDMFWLWGVAAGALGWFFGRAVPAPVCSSCTHHVHVAAPRCDFCSVKLAGDIREPAERFAAEDRYWARLVPPESDAPSVAEKQEHSCPRCGWVPSDADVWSCDCGQKWNTFSTRGRCPGCGKTWDTTWCLACEKPSDYRDW
jgi:hypothetical protein